VTQVLIMCDGEGNLGDPDAAKRQTAVENHYKWVDAAKFLGCHTIRVNGYSSGAPDEQMKLVADGMRKLVEYADKQAINVVIENHGGLSSNAKWLLQTIKMVNHPRAGTLPDFGNFRIAGPNKQNPNAKVESYDSYVGVAELMPLAKGVSIKPRVWDFEGNSSDIDLLKMMKIVVDAGYHGHCGIEHGPEGNELVEGNRLPAPVDPHGYKIPSAGGGADVPNAVPLFAVRIGGRILVSVPGEMSAGMGRRVREAVRDATGVPATIAGLANEYLSYFVTPEEYDQQHYEGASTLYGRATSVLIQMSLTDLAQRLVRGEPAPEPHPFDPVNGVSPDGAPFPLGAEAGEITAQPQDVERLQHATFSWRGGERGFDRPLDAAFIRVERRGKRRWTKSADDLGMAIAWNQDAENVYRVQWEVPLHARAASYRFVVTANHYRLVSEPFRVRPATSLRAQAVQGGLRLLYPVAVPNEDFNARPEAASGGRITYTLDGRRRTRKVTRGQLFRLPAGASVAAGAVRDRYGNRNASAVNAGA
jgi:sugar phosphate isomerase/epimerase